MDVVTAATTFQREVLTSALLDEMVPLLSAHWAEIAPYRDIPLDPDWETYLACERAGALRVYVARDQGQVVGYAAFIVRHDLKYKTSLQATGCGIYLSPDKRNQAIGSKLIDFADSALRAEGVQVVYHFVSDKCDYSKTLERLGYAMVDKVFGRRLD